VISVLLPVHNEEANLHRTLESVLCQTCRDFELIIVDDGSTDGTRAVLERYSRRDSRVRVLSQSKTGISAALNRGLDAAWGSSVARIDAGDVAMPNWLESQQRELQRRGEVDVMFGRIVLVDPLDEPFYVFPLTLPRNTTAAVMRDKSYPHPFVLCRTESLRKLGGYPRKDGIEDHLLWNRVARSGGRLAVNPRIVGIQVRTDAHNEIVESRLSRRYSSLPQRSYERMLLRAYMERRVIYRSNWSESVTSRLSELMKRHPLAAAVSLLRAAVMALAARMMIVLCRRRVKEALHEARSLPRFG
jgi:glycosyltransferase involved in cell wall biosynthesis